MDRDRDAFHRVALGLGGNVGDVPATIAAAVSALHRLPATRVLDVSRLYRTPPWGKTDQDWFVNACAVIETGLAPQNLLESCLTIERRLKRDRVKDERWGPRTIDIDILTYGDRSIESPDLIVPHPRMTERAFVMVPLAEIAPELVVNGRRSAEWATMLQADGIEPCSRPDWWQG